MKAKKLFRFDAIKNFENVLEYPQNMKGKWATFFDNKNPIVLELACGKGEYSIGMAEVQKDKNFIGIDVKGNRIFVGAKKAMDLKLSNVAFVRTQIQMLETCFASGEVDEIWIIFPDPFLRASKAKNRLTDTRFLKIYQHILAQGHSINLKTDSAELMQYTEEMIELNKCVIEEKINNIYSEGEASFPLSIKTFYEKQHLAEGRIIQYIRFVLPKEQITILPKKRKELDEKII